MSYGFIFDLDGVITDTAEYHYLSWKRLADEEGLTFSRKDNDALRGLPRQESLKIFQKDRLLNKDQIQDWMKRKNDYFHESLKLFSPDNLLPGVHDLMQSAKQNNIKIGLASSSRNARPVCARLGILDLFDAFADGNDITNAKPAPDVFLWVAGGLRLIPQKCVIFEDSEAGVEAGLSGKFSVVGIGPKERLGKAHRVIDSLAGYDISDFAPPLYDL